jgi:hypothetical protein
MSGIIGVSPDMRSGVIGQWPSTQPNVKVVGLNWGGDITGTTETVVAAYYAWTNTISSSRVMVDVTFHAEIKVHGGGSSATREATWILYNSTSAVADVATSGFGTQIGYQRVGRTTDYSGADGLSGAWSCTICGEFTSNATIGTAHYLGLTSDAANANTRHETWGGSSYLTQLKTFEFNP